MRKEFRATAESRKRPPLIAEAMVDADVAIPGVIEKGKLLTLTTDEALEHKSPTFAPTRWTRSGSSWAGRAPKCAGVATGPRTWFASSPIRW